MLRNAFDLLATEGTLRNILRAVTYARDINDRMRVIVDNQANVAVLNGGTTATTATGSSNPVLWGALSWNTVDGRYAYGEQTVANYIQNRERWSVS